MSDRPDLALILADAREEAQVLRSHGHTSQAKSIETLAERVADSMRSYLTTLSEKEASLRSGWTANRLRSRFAEWSERGLAMLDERGRRRYRELIVPARPETDTARLRGIRGEGLAG